LTEDKRAEVLALHAQGLSRNEIARQSGVSVGSVTNICKKSGASFDRSLTKDATHARKVDLAEARVELAHRLTAAANDMLDMLDKPFTVFSFGGKENTFASEELDSPPVDARRTIITSTAIVFDKITRIIEKSDDGLEDAIGVADKLAAGFEEIARIARATQETLSDDD
jgi:transcriptional regulator with XRE-family HTH domain